MSLVYMYAAYLSGATDSLFCKWGDVIVLYSVLLVHHGALGDVAARGDM